MKRRLSIISMLGGLTAACSGGNPSAPTIISSTPTTTTAATRIVHAPITASVLAGEASPVTLHVEPKAVCLVNGQEGGAPLGASPTGKLYMHLQGGGAIELSCTTPDGTVHVHPVTLAAVDKLPELAVEEPDGPKRPALVRDPQSYTEAELLAGGYPRRPADSSSPAYQRWLTDVMTPKVIADPTMISMPNRHATMQVGVNGPGRWSPNWSGYIMNGTGTYLDAQGTFTMSQVSDGTDAPGYTDCINKSLGGSQFSPGPLCLFVVDSTEWVGIDGAKSGQSIVQAGVESTWSVSSYNFSTTVNTSYLVWTEYFPGDTFYPQGYPVNPGDQIFIDTAVTNPNGSFNLQGGYGSFYLSVTPTNGGTGWVYSSIVGAPPGAPAMLGATAEWIMEKPTKTEAPFTNTWLDPLGKWSYANVADVYAMTFRSTQDLTAGSYINMVMCSGPCLTNRAAMESRIYSLPAVNTGPMLFWSWLNY